MAETIANENIAVEQQQQNGPESEQKNGTSANGANGEAEKKVNTEQQPPKKLEEDPAGWVNQQSKAAMHKVNFQILQWINGTIGGEKKEFVEREPGFVTRGRFLDFLRDGTILSQLTNALQPDEKYNVEAGKDVNNQKANLEHFLEFAKEKAGIEQDQLFQLKDLQEKGKSGYQAVLNTLFHLSLISQDKFGKESINVDEVKDAAGVTESNFFQNLLKVVKRANPPSLLAIRKSISSMFGSFTSDGSKSEVEGNPKAETQTSGTETQPGTSSTNNEQGSENAKPEEKVETTGQDAAKP